VFLYTQEHFKIFWETDERNAVLTFPYGSEGSDRLKACNTVTTSIDFPQAIFIVFYAAKCKFAKMMKDGKIPVATIEKTVRKIVTPLQKSSPMKKESKSIEEHNSKRRKMNQSDVKQNDMICPTFISRYREDGSAVYTPIRVASRKEVAEYEQAIESEMGDWQEMEI
jgi:hypothetical protein